MVRRPQAGTGSRSELIRTYNYKDNRVTDHRLSQNFSLAPALEGDIEIMVQSCITQDQQAKLEQLAAEAETPV